VTELSGFWVHMDADVLDPSVMPAVDSPDPNGLAIDEVYRLLRTLVASPRCAGFQLTIDDPDLDPTPAAHGYSRTSLSTRSRLDNAPPRPLTGRAGNRL
jgi:arginase family enzyme